MYLQSIEYDIVIQLNLQFPLATWSSEEVSLAPIEIHYLLAWLIGIEATRSYLL